VPCRNLVRYRKTILRHQAEEAAAAAAAKVAAAEIMANAEAAMKKQYRPVTPTVKHTSTSVEVHTMPLSALRPL